ncbi:S-layer homology domain-containing protein [Paenibacillus psychroresistens]|uniref:S-layer homology domain-containing protein n=2 Tax=Paenibacillus psychroresistens TaxID=1778678 RepID=A0A6B8RWJ1_9BACL|nr:S-layer homology domain-containing protein [Paenibacillus psychroresistens]
MLTPVLAFASASYSKGNVTGSVYSTTYAPSGVQVYVYAPGATTAYTTTSATYISNGINDYEYLLDTDVTGVTYRYVTLVTDTVSQVVYDVPTIAFTSPIYNATIGSQVTSVVYATYSNGDIEDASAYATIISDNVSVATVNAGTITPVSVGYSNLTATYAGQSVTSTVYVYAASTGNPGSGNPGSGDPGTGGGATPAPTVTISADANGNVDATSLTNAFANSLSVTIKITGESALLPASALVEAAKKAGASLTITSDNGSITIPLSVLKLDDLAKALGISVADLTIKVTISKVTGATLDAIKAAAATSGATLLADAIDFNVQAVAKDGKSINVDFGNTYVSRTLNVNSTVDSSNTTGILYNPDAKTFNFVPSTFANANGKSVATLKRNGSSIYTVASFNKSFSDISTHWAKKDIELLANKVVVEGMSSTTFAPESNITRAQFAALVVRSLGLTTSVTSNTYFKDVNASDWFAGAVTAAAKAGLINGYEDGTFAPNKQITREELAALVVRALKYAGVKADVTVAQQATLLAKYTDSNKIVWAQAEVAAAINAGIINGLTDKTIGSNKTATRAQSATMLKRFLTKAEFIN